MTKSSKTFRDMTEGEQQALIQCVQAHAMELQEQAHKKFRGWCYMKLSKQHDMHPLSIVSIAERAWLDTLGAKSRV